MVLYTHTALYRRTGDVLSLTHPLTLGFRVNAARGLSGALTVLYSRRSAMLNRPAPWCPNRTITGSRERIVNAPLEREVRDYELCDRLGIEIEFAQHGLVARLREVFGKQGP